MSIISKCLKWLRHSLRNAVVFPLSFIMPRSRHKWLFGSNMGFAGNAKYLFIYLNEHPDEGIRPLWIAKNRQELKQMKAMGLEAFRRWSAKGTYHALTSKYYLYNSYATDLHTVAMGRAVKVNLWHGVGIKTSNTPSPSGHYAMCYTPTACANASTITGISSNLTYSCPHHR